MKKKILAVLVALVVLISGGVVYINKVVLPTKIKNLIISGLEQRTHKTASLESLRLNIFKGLVVRNLVLRDQSKVFLSLEEGSCTFLVWPFFKKQVFIPGIKFKNAVIFLHRRQDSTFNLSDLFPAQAAAPGKPGEQGFTFIINKVTLVNCRVDFLDDTLQPAFSKSLNNLNLAAYLSLPSSIKFKFQAQVLDSPQTRISANGNYKIPGQELQAQVFIKGVSLKLLHPYYRASGIKAGEGIVDLTADLDYKDNNLQATLLCQGNNLNAEIGTVSLVLNSDIRTRLSYDFKDKALVYSGNAEIRRMDLFGIAAINRINNIRGPVKFDNKGFSAEKLSLQIHALDCLGKISIPDYANPILNIDLTTAQPLEILQPVLEEDFKIALPVKLSGDSGLSVSLKSKLPVQEPVWVGGDLDIVNGTLLSGQLKQPVKNIDGRIEFSNNQLKWKDLNLRYQEKDYRISGVLTDFHSPGVELSLASDDLEVQTLFGVKEKNVKVAKFSGTYLRTRFSFSGDIDLSDLAEPQLDIAGGMDVNLEDLSRFFYKFKVQLERIKPKGMIHAVLSLKGNPNDLKFCDASVKLTGKEVSAYGLNSQEFYMDYLQANGILDVDTLKITLYDGVIDGSAKLNAASQNIPWWIAAQVKDVNIAKLKLDTAAKDKDLAGFIQGEVKINGFSNNPDKISGAGKVFIKDGRLWELNLLKGVGKLIFAKDFVKVVFHDGFCSFLIQDRMVSTDNLKLKSDIAEVNGIIKIGFDSSLKGRLDINILDEMVPLTGTFKDVTTALAGQAGRVGVVILNGTLQDANPKFEPAVLDILKGIKKGIQDALFKK